ncbi:MAG: DNA-binding domain-containing protein [Pseudomonadota bacterium]
MSTELATLQHQFLQALQGTDTNLTTYIAPQPDLTATERLHIYRRNTQGTRHNTLQAIYPITRAMLGDDCFQTLARHYAQDHPAAHWNLNQYGADLPAWLANPPDAFSTLSDLPYLADLSQLELLLHQAYYAADAAAFPVTDYAALTPGEQTRVQLHLAPATGLLQSTWPVCAIWQHWQQHGTPPGTLPCPDQPDTLCIHRAGLQPQVSRITSATYQLLTHLQQHDLATLAARPDTAPALPALPDCIAQGWISHFILPH